VSTDLKIPKGWSKVTLGDVATEYSVRVDNPAESDYERFVGSNHIRRFELTVSNWGSTSEVTSTMKVFQPGDYLLVRRSLYASDFRERAARADFEGVCSGDILTVREKEDVVAPGFLSAVLNTPQIWAYIVAHATGSITRRIKWRQLQEYEFSLPPLEDQRKVVAMLASVDEAIQATQVLTYHTERVKKRLLQDLLTKGIGHTEFKKTVVGEIPAGWEVLRLDNLATFRRGSFPQPYGSPEWYDDENGHPFVQVYDLGDDMRLKQKTKKRISDLAAEKSVFVPTGSIILTIQGSIGRVALTHYDVYLDRTLLVFRAFLHEVDPYFFMNAIYLLFQQEKRKAPGSTIKTITKEKLKAFNLSLPPLAEQQEIAAILSSVDKRIANCEERAKQLQRVKVALLQGLHAGEDMGEFVKPPNESTLSLGDHA
jgi:type I restriction enzyme, S subunit